MNIIAFALKIHAHPRYKDICNNESACSAINIKSIFPHSKNTSNIKDLDGGFVTYAIKIGISISIEVKQATTSLPYLSSHLILISVANSGYNIGNSELDVFVIGYFV